jgi:hypothetical protein
MISDRFARSTRKAYRRRRRDRIAVGKTKPRRIRPILVFPQEYATLNNTEEKLLQVLSRLLHAGADRATSRNQMAGPHAHPTWLAEASYDLETLKVEVSATNWDGQGAPAVTSQTMDLAGALLSSMDQQTLQPEIGAGPSGEVIFYWWGAPGNSMTLELFPSGRLIYAALFDSLNTHGVEQTYDGTLPASIRLALARISEPFGLQAPAKTG